LSRLHSLTSAHVSNPYQALAPTWDEFVQLVISLTVLAYQAMNDAHFAKSDWEENVFTANLADFLRRLAFDQELPIHVHSRIRQHTPAMKAGAQPTIEAKEIDLMLYGSWEREYNEVHFVWEAKRVGDERINKAYAGLNAEYVNEAIYRFIYGDYATGLNNAGVLAYVLAGDVPVIVSHINSSMGRIRRNPPLPPSEHLVISSPIGGFENVYLSNHTRVDTSTIQLHHLFFAFDFT
jgi:hypothetical protein